MRAAQHGVVGAELPQPQVMVLPMVRAILPVALPPPGLSGTEPSIAAWLV